MNRSRIAALLMAMLFLLAGCGRKTTDSTAPTMEETQPRQTEQETAAPGQPADETQQPTEDDSTEQSAAAPTEEKAPSAPAEGEGPSKPTDPVRPTEPSTPTEDTNSMSYDDYMSMGAEEQGNYMDSFGSTDAFFDWLHSAKEEHDAQNPEIEVGDGSIDLGDLEGGNG